MSFLICTAALAWGAHDKPVLRVDVAFSANACCSWQVWINGVAARDITVLPMYQGTEFAYAVPLAVQRITYLRMPLGQVKGMTATIRDIRITRGSHTVAQMDPASLPITAYFAHKRLGPHGVALTSTNTRPFIAVPVVLDTHEGKIQLLVARIETGPLRSIVGLLLFGAVLTTLVSLRSRRQAVWAAGLLITLALIRGLPWFSSQLHLRDSVRSAVGFASYQGLWKGREQLVVDLSVALAVLIPVVLCVITRQIRRPGLPATRADRPSVSRWLAAALIAVPVVLLALANMPNVRAMIGGPPQYVPNWDGNNFLFWMYLIQKLHMVPMRDFLWPYGFQSLFDEALPWGQLMSYVTSLSFWLFLALGSYMTLSRFFFGRGLVARYLVLTGFWLSVTLAGYWTFTTRYEAPLAVVLLFSAIRPTDRLVSMRRVVFAFAWVELIVLEPAQAIYASVPILFLLGVELLTTVRRTREAIARWLARSLVMLSVPTAAAMAVYAVTGEFHGTLSYYENLGAVTAQAALPGQVNGWVQYPTNLDSFIFWSVPIALVLGLFGFLSARDRVENASPIVVALALLGAMIMQKQAIRPGITLQIWLPVIFALIFWAVTESGLAPLRRWTAVSVGLGGIAAMLLVAGGFHLGWTNLRSGPNRVTESVGTLLHRHNALDATAREAFAPAAFSRFSQYTPIVDALRRIPSVRLGKPVWILGDDTPITIMLGLHWPYYYSDFYSSAPLGAQRLVLSRLRTTPPDRVVWNFSTQAMTFDTVPQVVRAPLLFQWAVDHLVPERIVGTYAILRLRGPGEKVPLIWWQRRIGKAVNLGHIPDVANLPSVQCVGAKSSCGSYMVVTVPPGTPIPGSFNFPVSVDGVSFSIQLSADSGIRRYVVPLDRLWFWQPNEMHAVRNIPTGLIDNVHVDLDRRLIDPNALY